MFKRQVKSLQDLLPQILRHEGLETPLQQKRLIDAWAMVVGKPVERYTGDKFIKNQTLFVQILNPALRADLTMNRTVLVQRLNNFVGAQVIADIRFY